MQGWAVTLKSVCIRTSHSLFFLFFFFLLLKGKDTSQERESERENLEHSDNHPCSPHCIPSPLTSPSFRQLAPLSLSPRSYCHYNIHTILTHPPLAPLFTH